jgi:hypothetical protein
VHHDHLPRLYTEFADWFHLLSAPAEYVEEADFYWRTIRDASTAPPRTLLELGSGGGNNAWHYKHHVPSVTLTDLSPGMLALSQRINPECDHVQADMRTLRLGREYDAVFTHDAIGYLTTEVDLRQALTTAFVHCRPGGVALFAPDQVRENFAPGTDHGGNDGGDGRALRYLEWTFDPDPGDTTYTVEYAYLLHEPGKQTRSIFDRHLEGLFARADWVRLLGDVGFAKEPRIVPLEHSEVAQGSVECFVARRPPA